MELYEFTSTSCIKTNVKTKNKEATLKLISKLAKNHKELNSCKEVSEDYIFQALSAREKECSTGFGDGIAIPHAQLKCLKEFVLVIITSKKGIDFDALDKKKVHLIFAILAPEGKVNEHLQILAAVSRALDMASVRHELLTAPNENVLYESFVRHSKKVVSSSVEKMKLLKVVLYYEEFLYDILELFIESGIDGASITNGEGMGSYISNIPLFAGFLGFMQEKHNSCKIIDALVPENQISEIVSGIEKITGDLDKKQGAVIMSFNIEFLKGSMKMM